MLTNQFAADDGDNRIHVCYAISDAKGTYSKFAGASIGSLFENTLAKVTVHLLHDDNLSEINRARFTQLAEQYGQQIIFYNVPVLAADIWQRARDTFAKAIQSEYYTAATMYRLIISDLLPPSVHRLIYIDADTIVNMDIGFLWNEPLGESGFGAVSERDMLAHYGRQVAIPAEEKFYLMLTGRVTRLTVFNAGVLLLDLDKWRRRGNLLLEGLSFLAEHADECEFFDQDILNYFFAADYTNLSWRYNIKYHWDRDYGEKENPTIVRGIYHYIGRAYRLDCKDARHLLFMESFLKTPWCDTNTMFNVYNITQITTIKKCNERMARMRHLFTIFLKKRRVFVGRGADEERLRGIFELAPEEPYIAIDKIGQNFSLPFDVSTHVYVFFLSTGFDKLRQTLIGIGLKEEEHFIDGLQLLPPSPAEKLMEDWVVLWQT